MNANRARFLVVAFIAVLALFSFVMASMSDWSAPPVARSPRWQQVWLEAGPPPTQDAVPVLGHTTATGVKVRSHWRSRPDSTADNNLRRNAAHRSGGK